MFPGVKASGTSGPRMDSTGASSRWVRLRGVSTGMVREHGNKHEQLLDISLQAERTGVPGPANREGYMAKSIFLEANHIFLRNPRGGIEDVEAMARAGFDLVFCNVGDHDVRDWNVIRQQAARAGVICGPWLRTADGQGNFSKNKFEYLLEVADEWRTPLIVNSESELRGTGRELTDYMSKCIGGRDAAISVEPWPFANTEWWPLGRYPFLPQIFPQDSDAATRPEACKEKWHYYDVECVVFTFGTYGRQQPSDYNLLRPYGLYTADDCGGNYIRWLETGVHPKPCDLGEGGGGEEGEDMPTKIGSQHGATAMANTFRDAWPNKTILKKKADGSWPPISTIDSVPQDQWKAIDKWERAQLILVQDHDSQMSG